MSSPNPSLDIPKNPSQRRAWLVYQLKLRGLSARQLALREGVSREAIGGVMNTPSATLERVVARSLGLMPQELFPERYDAAGRRLIPTRERYRNRASSDVAGDAKQP